MNITIRKPATIMITYVLLFWLNNNNIVVTPTIRNIPTLLYFKAEWKPVKIDFTPIIHDNRFF